MLLDRPRPGVLIIGRMKTLRTGLVLLVVAASMTAASVRADQPEMRAALENLRAARHHLEHAEHNKGGWRVRAIENTDRAIHETEAGMEHAR